MYYPDFFEGLTTSNANVASNSAPLLPPPPVPEMTRLRSQETVATIGSMAGDFCDLMKSGDSFNVLDLIASSTSKTGESISNLLLEEVRFPSLQKADLDWLAGNDDDDDDDDDDLDMPYNDSTSKTAVPPPLPLPAVVTRSMSSRLLGSGKKPVAVKARKASVEKPRRQRKLYEVAAHQRKYVQYTDMDVLCQRGGLGNQHVGNKRYLAAKEAMQVLYQATPKAGRTAVAQQLVDQVRSWGGRFLTRDAHGWYEIHNHKARTKASQALREDYSKEELREKRNKYKAARNGQEWRASFMPLEALV